ncbi:MAG: hypothetical protein QFF03_08775 [Pseudomonadota bacterium]|nr:hypothetical protein [Pseudomonadota bacterium]
MHGGVVVIDRHHHPSERGLFALAVALLLHAALLGIVLRRPPPPLPDVAVPTMLWLKLAPPAPVPVPRPEPPAPAPARHSHKAAPAMAAVPALPLARAPMPPVAPPEAPAAPAEAPPTHLSLEQILSNARRDVGKIDQQVRKERSATFGSGPGTVSVQQRLEKGFEEAHQAAPNKWYQAAKIEDITPPGDDQRKIYRITGVAGTFCVRYADKNRKFDHGQANLGEPLIGACPHMF